MTDFSEIRGKIEDSELEEALALIDNELERQGDNPDEELLLFRIEVCFNLAGKKAEFEDDFSYYGMTVDLLEKMIEKSKMRPYYPQLLHMMTVSLLTLGYEADALYYAEQLYETHGDDPEAAFLLSGAYSANGTELEKAETLIDEYLSQGDYVRGIPVKILILILLNKYEEALSIINVCTQAYPKQSDMWEERRIFLYAHKGDADTALSLIEGELSDCDDYRVRKNFFEKACVLLNQYKSHEEVLRYINKYIRNYSGDDFAYFGLARELKGNDLNGSIAALEKAYAISKDSHFAQMLLKIYLDRDAKKDRIKYFQILDNFLADEEENHWQGIKTTMYGEYYPFDDGQCIEILKKDLRYSPDHECTYTMLGKLYECGIGGPADFATARYYYKTAYTEHRSACGCSAVFYAYALYYGIGGDMDIEKAIELILEVIHERSDDSDRNALYAVVAFETQDKRFDKKFALRLLREDKEDAAAAYLLSKFSDDDLEKKESAELFKKLIKKADALERDYLQKYLKDDDIRFIPFIRN